MSAEHWAGVVIPPDKGDANYEGERDADTRKPYVAPLLTVIGSPERPTA